MYLCFCSLVCAEAYNPDEDDSDDEEQMVSGNCIITMKVSRVKFGEIVKTSIF